MHAGQELNAVGVNAVQWRRRWTTNGWSIVDLFPILMALLALALFALIARNLWRLDAEERRTEDEGLRTEGKRNE